MTIIAYPNVSAYAKTPQSTWAIGRYVHRSIPADSGDTSYVVEMKYNGRPDNLAYDTYGFASLFWVFMVRNMDVMRDPFFDLVTGLEITIPSASYLKSLGIL